MAEVQGFAQSFTSKQVTTNELRLADANGTSCYTRSQIDAAVASLGNGAGAGGGGDSAGNQFPPAAQQSQSAAKATPESVTQNSTNSTNSASSTDATTTAASPATTPPTIAISGNNPAVIQVGASYDDLGATVSDTGTGQAGDANLGIKTFLNGTLVSNIVIDTSEVATDTIATSPPIPPASPPPQPARS